MSNIVQKVKDAVSGHGHSHPNDPNTASTNHGPHNTNIANQADPRVDSDLDGRAGTGKYTSASNAGPHDSNISNKLDPRVDSDRDGSKTVGNYGNSGFTGAGTHPTAPHTGAGHHTGSTNAGPHNSNVANKADPRVDSDLDGSRNFGASTGATGASAYGNTGYSGTGHSTTGHTTGSTNAGPHNSNLLNKADPRVDSDLDGSRNYGAATGATGASAYSGTGSSAYSGTGSTNAGPHNSNLLNKADPRVDSDLDGSRNIGANSGTTGYGSTGTTGYGSTGTTGTHGTHGTHTGATGTHGTHGTHGHHGVHHTGPAPNTAGPHNSDLLNKADPRVDSDLDGSRTVGGNKTYTS